MSFSRVLDVPSFSMNDTCATWSHSSDIAKFWISAVDARLSVLDGIAPLSSDTLQDTFHALDDEEYAILCAARTVRARRNSLAPISRLPPELMTRIFTLYADAEDGAAGSAHALACIRVTHVCQRWRHIALDSAGMWADVDFALGENCAAEFITRSKTAPLSFHAARELASREHDLIVANIARTTLLRLHSGDHTFTSFFQSLDQPSPLLETLDITDSNSDEGVAFRLDLLGDRAPNLRHFKLSSGSPMPWASPLLHDLSTLEISLDRDAPYRPGPSLDDILSALERMPKLTRLKIVNDLPNPTPDAPHRLVHLPRLTRLTIGASLASCSHMLTHLAVPPVAMLRLSADVSDEPKERLLPFFTDLAAWLRAGHPFAPTAARITGKDSGLFRAEAWRALGGDMETARAEDADIAVELTWTRGPKTRPADAARAACALCASPQLEQLAVDVQPWVRQTWTELVESSPALRRIVAHGFAGATLGIALQDLDAKTGEGAVTRLPKLASIALCDSNDFDSPVGYADGQSLAASAVLLRLLAARADAGHPVEELVMKDCNVRGEWVDSLREAVPGLLVRVQ